MSDRPTADMPRWKVWLVAARPRTLTTSTSPILAASVLAWLHGEVSPLLTVLMLLASIATHAGTNFTNDYFDHKSGVDTVQQVGPGGMLQRGHLTETDLRNAIIASFTIAFLAALPVMLHVGWIVLAIGVFAAAVAYFYTAGPYPLAYNRMGEVGVFLAMGVAMVCGTFYVHTGTVTWTAFWLSVAIGLYAAAILHANNIRDIEVDRAHGKHTVANTFGRDAAVIEYAILVIVPLAIGIGLVVARPGFWPILMSLAVLPFALKITGILRQCATVAECNVTIPLSAVLHLRFTLLLTAGLATVKVLSL